MAPAVPDLKAMTDAFEGMSDSSVAAGRQFISCCRKGDQTRAAAILAANPAVFNAQDINGMTALMWALTNSHHSTARWLLARPGLDCSLASNYRNTALHCACWHAAPLDILTAIAARMSPAAIEKKDRWNGRTALEFAMERDHSEAVLLLRHQPQSHLS